MPPGIAAEATGIGAATNEPASPANASASVPTTARRREVGARRSEGGVLMGSSSTIARPGLSNANPTRALRDGRALVTAATERRGDRAQENLQVGEEPDGVDVLDVHVGVEMH